MLKQAGHDALPVFLLFKDIVKKMADGRGFEPRRGVNPNTLSRRAP